MEEAFKVVQGWRNNAFIRNNAIFWTASLVVSFLNYIYYPIMGRLMEPAAFGETQTIISIFTQTGVFFQVLSLVSIGIITKYSKEIDRNRLTDELSRLVLYFSVVMFSATIIFSPWLKQFFNFGSLAPFLVLAISLIVSVPLSFANSYLQGYKRFGTLSIGNLLASSSKIIFSIIFVLLGFQAVGAVGGIVCAQLVALVYALRMGRGTRHFISENLHFKKPHFKILKPEMPYILMVLATSLTTNLLLSFDILVVKHSFPPEQAGLYTGISIISNIIYFITGPFAAVLIPSVKPSQSLAKNYRVLRKSLFLTTVVGGSVFIFFVAFPHFVVSTLLGDNYAIYANFLPGLSLALFMLSLSNLLIYYHIGLRHFWVAPAVISSLILTLLLLAEAQASMTLIVRALVIGSAVLLVLLIGLLGIYRKEPT